LATLGSLIEQSWFVNAGAVSSVGHARSCALYAARCSVIEWLNGASNSA